MCAEYNLKTTERELNQLLQVSILNETAEAAWDDHYRLYATVPMLKSSDGGWVMDTGHFSLLPPGGRTPFTANTRLDDWDERRHTYILAFERPTWRDAFLRRRCVIPVTEFLEPVYQGEFAGQIMGFSRADTKPLLIAAIYQDTINRETGEVYRGFSMMTDFAHPLVQKIGHHRTVVSLDPEAAARWADAEPIDGVEGAQFLMRERQEPPLEVRAVRTMKGWKARVKNSLLKHAHELEQRPRIEAARKSRGLT